MKYLIALLILLSSSVFAETKPAPELDCEGLMGRLSQAAQVFKDISTTDATPLDQIVQLYLSRTLIPEGGHLHVVGSGRNFYEWLIPLLVRPDIQITVSDKPELYGSNEFQITAGPILTEEFLLDVRFRYPELIGMISEEVSAEFLSEQIQQRVFTFTDVRQSRKRADFVVMISPLMDSDAYRYIFNRARSDGALVWMVSDDLEPPVEVVNIQSVMNMFSIAREPYQEVGVGLGNFYSGEEFYGAQGGSDEGFLVLPRPAPPAPEPSGGLIRSILSLFGK